MKKVFAFFCLIVVSVSGCTQSEKKEEIKTSASRKDTASKQQENQTGQGEKKIVARVNGNPIYEEDLRGKSLQAAINDEILYQEGLRQGLDKKFEGDIERYKKRLIVDSLRQDFATSLPKDEQVSEQQIKKYYERHLNKYTFISLKEISVRDKSTAEEVRNKLIAGEDSAKIQSELGDKVVITNLNFNKKHNDKFDKKEVGSVSQVITEDGNQFKILQITDVRHIPLEKASNAIRYTIIATRKGKATQEKVQELKKENNIKVEVLTGNTGKTESDENEAN